MDFWTTLEKMLESHDIIIDRPKGSRHPRFSEMVYPFDYGYLQATSSGDGNEIDVCLGTRGDNRLIAVICTVDNKKQDTEVKLLIGCTEEEIVTIDRFFNSNLHGAGIVVRRDL